MWINPYIAQHGAAFKTAAEKGYLLKRKNGDVWQWDLWQGGMGLVDFTNPEATKWFVDCLNGLFDQGVDCIKTDFGERIPTLDVEWHDKSVDAHKMHVSFTPFPLPPPYSPLLFLIFIYPSPREITNTYGIKKNYYAFIYNKIVYEALQARYGESEAVLFARSACAGTQRFPLVWGGDCESTPEAMAESVRGGLSLGLGGFSFWSNDIGGFEGLPTPWIYKRWVAFGLLCSHSRLHGSSSYRVPWLIDDDDKSAEACSQTLSSWTALKNRLMPYLYAQGIKAAANGWPLSLRAMCLEFPEDPTAWFLDRQFMVGESLLAAPVFAESGEVEFYLPKGKWTSFFTNETRDGPGWFKEKHGFGSMPLWVRENTVLVLGKEGVRGAVYDYAQDVEICLYHVKEGASAELVDNKGAAIGTLRVVGADLKVEGKEVLKGSWTTSLDGREFDKTYLQTIHTH